MIRPRRSPWNPLLTLPWLVGYLLTMVAIFYGLSVVRENQQLQTEAEAEAVWTEWRQAATEQASSTNSVQRKIPKSHIPPIRVLLLEHFKTMVAAALIFGSILYGMVSFFICGIFAKSNPRRPEPSDSAKRTTPN